VTDCIKSFSKTDTNSSNSLRWLHNNQTSTDKAALPSNVER